MFELLYDLSLLLVVLEELLAQLFEFHLILDLVAVRLEHSIEQLVLIITLAIVNGNLSVASIFLLSLSRLRR